MKQRNRQDVKPFKFKTSLMPRPKTDFIVIHCAYTKLKQTYTAQMCHRDHLARGFSGIGYNYFIELDGHQTEGRGRSKIGAGVKGKNNQSIHICLEGGKGPDGGDDPTAFTVEQINQTRALIESLKRIYPRAVVVGHNELSGSKTCPVIPIKYFREDCCIKAMPKGVKNYASVC